MTTFRQILTHNLLNVPGWRTRRHILVIESDDWGSIRMPSKAVYDAFLAKGIAVDKDPYCRYDNLATREDLEALFGTLSSVRDIHGNPAVLTANTVVANPVFDKIKASDFTEYHYEPFTDTLDRYPSHDGAFSMWKEGMQAGVFHPQLHGREHLNVRKWLRMLRAGEPATTAAFELGTFGLTSAVAPTITRNYMGAFNSGLREDTAYYGEVLREGADLFELLFGYRSASFIATTYCWNTAVEPALKACGVKYLQGMVHQCVPLDDDTTFRYKKNNFTGFKSPYGLTYVTRNCHFEPSQSAAPEQYKYDCLNRIRIAFRWHKPAVVSMHRLNVIGSIVEENRTRNLADLRWILQEVKRLYPDVEFMTTDRLGDLMTQE